jgi:hypothetical protein
MANFTSYVSLMQVWHKVQERLVLAESLRQYRKHRLWEIWKICLTDKGLSKGLSEWDREVRQSNAVQMPADISEEVRKIDIHGI